MNVKTHFNIIFNIKNKQECRLWYFLCLQPDQYDLSSDVPTQKFSLRSLIWVSRYFIITPTRVSWSPACDYPDAILKTSLPSSSYSSVMLLPRPVIRVVQPA